jgi:hypothetical protein
MLTMLIGLIAQMPAIPLDSVCAYTTKFVGPCYTVHGRLSGSNGAFAYKIWIVGTHRLLGVDLSAGCVLPKALDDAVGAQEREVFADFVVRPLTPDRPGEMRRVCVASAARLVVRPVQ